MSLHPLPPSFEPQQTQQIAEAFFQEGCVLVPAVLSREEAGALRARTDGYAEDERTGERHHSYVGETFVLRRCHELNPLFAGMLAREPILQIVDAVLGAGAKFNAMNIIRNKMGQAISNWHIDDVLEFPLPEAIPRFDARIRMPVFWMTVQVALSDIDVLEHGPTQYVPGSHYSGRQPVGSPDPEFEGRGPVSVLCRAGDIYLTNHQCWHRGAPNISSRTRYVMQLQFAQRWADARFKGTA